MNNVYGFIIFIHLPCISIPFFSLMVSWVLSLSYIVFFVSSFDATDATANTSIPKINNDLVQAMPTFSSDTWKTTLYDLNFSEQRKEIGMSHRKLFGYQFHLLKIHIYFQDAMCTWGCWRSVEGQIRDDEGDGWHKWQRKIEWLQIQNNSRYEDLINLIS